MIRVLVIQHDHTLTDMVSSALCAPSYQITSITDTGKFDASVDYDLLIIDYKLSKDTFGLEFYQELKRNGADFPAILVTDFQDQIVLTEALRAGVRDFLPKGDVFSEVLPLMVQRVLAESERERELASSRRMRIHAVETHHRVKNSFQIVHSLLNMELRKHNYLDKIAVANVIRHIQGLCVIHDILSENISRNKLGSAVSANDLIARLLGIFRFPDPERRFNLKMETEIIVNGRIASSLSVIITELLINALKYGCDDIYLSVHAKTSSEAKLRLSNRISPSITETRRFATTGSALVDFLALSDFKSKLRRGIDQSGAYFCELSFPTLESAERLLRSYKTSFKELHAKVGVE